MELTKPMSQPWYVTFVLLVIGPPGWLVLYLRGRNNRKRFYELQ